MIGDGKEGVNKVSKWLGKLYPVYPYAHFEVLELDVLDTEKFPKICSENIREKTKMYLDQYESAHSMQSIKGNHKLRYYNNSTWYVDDADTMFDFIIKMEHAMEE